MTDAEIVGYQPICPDCGATGSPQKEAFARTLAEGHNEVTECENATVEPVTEADETTRSGAVGHA